jgi:hypothetical protein
MDSNQADGKQQISCQDALPKNSSLSRSFRSPSSSRGLRRIVKLRLIANPARQEKAVRQVLDMMRTALRDQRGSVDEPRPNVRRRDLARFSSPEPLVAMADDETVASVAESTRNDPCPRNPEPRRTESRKDLEDRVRLCVDRVVLDQNHAGQLASAASVVFDYCPTGRRLLCGEPKNTRWIAPYYESHPGVA